MYQDLSLCYDWPVKNLTINLPLRLKGNSKRISGNLLSLLEAQNKDIGATSKTLLAGVKLRLQVHRLVKNLPRLRLGKGCGVEIFALIGTETDKECEIKMSKS